MHVIIMLHKIKGGAMHDICKGLVIVLYGLETLVWVGLQALVINAHHMSEGVCHKKAIAMSHVSEEKWMTPHDPFNSRSRLELPYGKCNRNWCKITAWGGSNNHKSLATHSLS